MDASIEPALSECRFYHAMDLPGLGSIDGEWDLRGRFDEYIGGIDLRGQTVLDVVRQAVFYLSRPKGEERRSSASTPMGPSEFRSCRQPYPTLGTSTA